MFDDWISGRYGTYEAVSAMAWLGDPSGLYPCGLAPCDGASGRGDSAPALTCGEERTIISKEILGKRCLGEETVRTAGLSKGM